MPNSIHEDTDEMVENSYLGGRHLILSDVELKPHPHPQRKAVQKTAKFQIVVFFLFLGTTSRLYPATYHVV